MLFTPIVRPLDLGGTSELNRAVNERHVIDSDSARIFVPQLGPFFKDSMTVVDVNTGKLLKEFEDYRLIHMVTEATHEANKEVTCVVYVTNPTVAEVLISYQAIGGIYAEGSIALIEILERFQNSKLPPVYWAQILNLPDAFQVTPHKHTLYDLEAIDAAISALTKVLDQLHARDIPKFQTLFDNLDKNINALLTQGDNYAQSLEQGFMRIESNSLYRKGQVKATDNNTNPFDYLGYGSWVRLEDVLLYGALPEDTMDPINNVLAASGHVARRTNFWEQISDVEGVSFNLSASATNVNEGQSVTFTLQTSGLPDGTKVPYLITGISAADITGSLTGDFVLNTQGKATVTITTVEDRLTEGVEVLTLALIDYPSIRRNVNVNDTSRSPSYSVRYTSDIEGKNVINAVDEGSEFYIFVQTEFVPDGQMVNLFYTGSTTNNADFNANLPTQLTISGGRAAYKMMVKNDQLTEGNESLVTGVSVSSADAILASSVLTIRDTSKAPAYNIIYSVSNTSIAELTDIDEGMEFWCLIRTENVPNDTVLTINNAGSVNDSDFEIKYPTSVIIQNNAAQFKLKLRNDLTTEGNETLSISLMIAGTTVFTKPIIINDSSPNPNANVKFSTNSTGTNSITTANEGSKVYLIIQTQGMPNGTAFNLVYSGTAEAADFDVARPNTVSVTDNRAVVEYSIKADQITDDRDETLIITLQNSFSRETLGVATLTIKDTSKASTYKLRFSANANGTGSITNANEGTTVYGIIETTDVDDGTVLNVATTIGGKVATVANGDVTINVATTATITSNFAAVRITLNNDLTNEGAEALIMTVSEAGTTLTTATMTVNDTSKAPTYSGRLLVGTPTLAPTESSAAATDVLVGNKYGVLVTTTNVPDGTTLYVRRNAAVEANTAYISDAAFIGTLNGALPPATITIQNNKAWIPFQVYSGWLDTDQKILTLGLYTAVSSGSPVVKITAPVLQASYELYWASDAAGATRITAVDEGKKAYLIVKHPNVPKGVYLNAELFINNVSQRNTPNVDVQGAGLGALFLDNNMTSLEYTFIADEIKEGNETFRMRVWPHHSVDNETPAWFRDVSITITDTSYRPDKVRAGVVNGQVNVLGNAIESFDKGIAATFITPEGGHEAWTIGLGTSNTNLTTNVWNRSGTTRVGYAGNTNWAVLDIRPGPSTGPLTEWQKSYHNEFLTVKDQHGISISGFDIENAVAFACPDGEHEGLYISRELNQIRPYIHNRSGTNRIEYTGLVSLTAMAKYLPHYQDHMDAEYPRIVYAQVLEQNEAVTSFEMFPYNIHDTTKYAIMMCPEKTHEGWSIKREVGKITADVFDRSGTDRPNYTGKLNWALVQLKADGAIDNPKRKIFARSGHYSYTFEKGKTYRITVVAGGGAGGNAIYYQSGATDKRGGQGEIAYVNMVKNGVNARIQGYGGHGGGRGCWNNGSAYQDGTNGVGGSAALPTASQLTAISATALYSDAKTGAQGTMAQYNAGDGGISPLSLEPLWFGKGGKGMYGSGDRQLGYGGAGGAGGSADIYLKFDEDQSANIFVGKGGAVYNDPTEEYQSQWHYGFGQPGKDGMVVIEDLGIISGDSIAITLAGTTAITETYNSKQIKVYVGTINLYDYYVSTRKRAPTVGEQITFHVPADTALVGATTTTPPIVVDDRWPGAVKLTINNDGYILGRGGKGAQTSTGFYTKTLYAAATAGGLAIHGSTKFPLTVTGNGIVAGGGGGGGAGHWSTGGGGGGGAPYGEAGVGSKSGSLYPGTFAVGGNGGYMGEGQYGGRGGDWGLPGNYASKGGGSGSWVPAAAGLTYTGLVTITK